MAVSRVWKGVVETRRLSTHVSIRHHLIFPCQIILLARLLTLTMGIFDCRYRFTTSLTRKGNCGNLFINTLSIEMHSFLFEIPTGTMSKKVFLYAQSRYFPNHNNMAALVRVRTHTLKASYTNWMSEIGLEPSDAQVVPCAVPLFYMCSCSFGGLLVYINSVTNYINSTQICVSPKGNVLVHKLDHRIRNRTQW